MSANLSIKSNVWLKSAVATLKKADIGSSRLDCLVLLEDVSHKERAWLLAHPEFELTDKQVTLLDSSIDRRMKHEPLAYIRGKTEFYGREFIVNHHVLEPRPESETMIELALKVIGSRLQVIDVGTGSGALAITIKLEKPATEVYATDIDPKCLKVAEQNAKKLDANVTFLQGNLLQPLYNLKPITYNLVLANLPYVPITYEINEAAKAEPKIAIYGGEDGLDLYRQLFVHLKTKPAHYVLTESLPFQHKRLSDIATNAGYKLQMSEDFIQVFVRL